MVPNITPIIDDLVCAKAIDYNIDISEDNWNFMIDNLTLEPGTYYLEVDGWISEWYSTYYELHVETVE